MIPKKMPQEWLKLIACITMLADHIGAILLPGCVLLRIIGRLSFPIYCFLLAEGAAHTRNAKRYALRLLICAVLSEIPHDLALGGRLTLTSLNTMFSLFLGFLMIQCMEKTPRWWLKLLIAGAFAVMGRFLGVSYGWRGILVMAVFALTRGMKLQLLWQLLGVGVLFLTMNSMQLDLGFGMLPIQVLGVLALIPIGMYGGQKLTRSKAVQWMFYLFYPVHFLVLYIVDLLT